MSAAALGLSPEAFEFLRHRVYAGSGIVLNADQQYLIEARLGPVARETGIASLDALCAALRGTPASPLHDRVVEAMTTNETYFFREPAHYDAIRNLVIPELIRQRESTRKLSFWSAAASTGQEAYSLAMLLLEMGLHNWKIEILSTDLSRQVLARAEAARYTQLEVNRGLPATLLLKYFRRSGLEWELAPEVRRIVRFRPFDLRAPMNALGPFDAVFCRNVLIYFDLGTRQSILDQIHGTLFRGAPLFLGAAEGGIPGADRYERRNVGPAVLYAAR